MHKTSETILVCVLDESSMPPFEEFLSSTPLKDLLNEESQSCRDSVDCSPLNFSTTVQVGEGTKMPLPRVPTPQDLVATELPKENDVANPANVATFNQTGPSMNLPIASEIPAVSTPIPVQSASPAVPPTHVLLSRNNNNNCIGATLYSVLLRGDPRRVQAAGTAAMADVVPGSSHIQPHTTVGEMTDKRRLLPKAILPRLVSRPSPKYIMVSVHPAQQRLGQLAKTGNAPSSAKNALNVSAYPSR